MSTQLPVLTQPEAVACCAPLASELLSESDAELLVADRAWAEYFEACVALGGDPKSVCNWMNSDFARLLNDTGQSVDPNGERQLSKVTPQRLVALTKLVQEGTISGKAAKEVFDEVFRQGADPDQVVEKKGLKQISDSGFITDLVSQVMAEFPDAVATYKGGKTGTLGFLVGKAIQKSQGRANPQMVQEEMKRRLDE